MSCFCLHRLRHNPQHLAITKIAREVLSAVLIRAAVVPICDRIRRDAWTTLLLAGDDLILVDLLSPTASPTTAASIAGIADRRTDVPGTRSRGNQVDIRELDVDRLRHHIFRSPVRVQRLHDCRGLAVAQGISHNTIKTDAVAELMRHGCLRLKCAPLGKKVRIERYGPGYGRRSGCCSSVRPRQTVIA